ncbi:MAG: xylulokinase, partial [Acidimicrobiia bacterium]|nr:xylulokinase [Acidimicrobiia bacterium]
MALVLGIDSSTQSTKVEVRQLADGALVAGGRGAHPPTTPPRSEQDPRAWVGALGEAIGQCGTQTDLGAVVAVSVAGQQHGLVVLGDDDEPLRPAKLWNDTESAAEADELVRGDGPRFWADACGSVPVAAFTITKLAWLAAHEPAVFDNVEQVLLPHDFLTWWLTGEAVTDRGDASGTGWWSPREDAWDLSLLARVSDGVDWAGRLPRILGPTETAGAAGPRAQALGLPASAVVGPGTGDNMAAALGLGLAPGDLALSFGTSGTAYAVSRTPTADATGAVAGFADASGHYLPLVCTLNATKVTDAVARLLGVDHDQFDTLALDGGPGANGVVLVPYLDGERTPNRPDATGSIVGLRSDIDRPMLARAAVEGVVCGLLEGADALAAAGVDTTSGRIAMIGGGTRSAAYRRVVADLVQRRLVIPAADELVALGACVQAAMVADGVGADEVARRWGLGE